MPQVRHTDRRFDERNKFCLCFDGVASITTVLHLKDPRVKHSLRRLAKPEPSSTAFVRATDLPPCRLHILLNTVCISLPESCRCYRTKANETETKSKSKKTCLLAAIQTAASAVIKKRATVHERAVLASKHAVLPQQYSKKLQK